MERPFDEDFLENVRRVFQKRYDEAKAALDRRVTDWKEFEDLYDCKKSSSQHSWESNLIIPKAHYVIETLTPQVLYAIFGQPQWVSFVHPDLDTTAMERWFVWFCDRIVRMYVPFCELLKAAPCYGTSFNKLYLSHAKPRMAYAPIDSVLIDPRHNVPGDIDGMPYVIHANIERSLAELEAATVTRVRIENVPLPAIDPATGRPVVDPETGLPVPASDPQTGQIVTQQVPVPYTEKMYFNLDKVWEKVKRGEMARTAAASTLGPETDRDEITDPPKVRLAEMWGLLELNSVFDPEQNSYTPGQYQEYVVTAVMKDNTVETIIRCEPSTFGYYDVYEERFVPLKPFITSLYSIRWNSFYGIGAVEPIRPMIAELEEHHNMLLDNHKRAVMTILSVLERSGLTRRQLELSPYNIWRVKAHTDVMPIKFPDIDTNAAGFVHGLIDREIDRTTGASTLMQGVPVTKRQTMGEVRAVLTEGARRFSTYIQLLDHITLRPAVFKLLILASQMPHVIENKAFVMPEGEVVMTPELLLAQHDMRFTATATESDLSKYARAEKLPRLFQAVGQMIQATGGQWMIDFPALMKDLKQTYDMPTIPQWVKPNPGVVPVDLLMQVTQQHGPQLAPVVQALVQQAQQVMAAQTRREEQ